MLKFTDIQLHLEKVACQTILSLDLLHDYKVDSIVSMEMEGLVLRLSRYIACTEEKTVQVVSYPASAWQHFKQEYFPKWLLESYPVKQVHVTVYAAETFPDLKITPNSGRTFKVRVLQKSDLKCYSE